MASVKVVLQPSLPYYVSHLYNEKIDSSNNIIRLVYWGLINMKLIEYYIYEYRYMFYRYYNEGIINPITQNKVF